MPTLKRSRVVLTPDEDLPYKVVLEHSDGSCSEHPVTSVREGEAMIRDHAPDISFPKVGNHARATPNAS